MSAEIYLQQTEDAVRQLIQAAIRYEQILAGHISPLHTKDQAQIQKYVEAAGEYFGLQFSQGTLCGSILQVAFMGIDLYSVNTTVPDDCSNLIGTSKKAVKFCVGGRVHGIPSGLLIYAGRNQYNHWDDKAFDYPTSQVFGALITFYYDNPLFDMAYELNYPERTVKSNHIVLGELGWNSYEKYYHDMRELLAL